MFYVGIDIGKRHHEAGLINDKGNPVGKTLRFSNSKKGSEKLLEFINQYNLTPDNSLVGIEATGHYWLSVFPFYTNLDLRQQSLIPCNPMLYENFIYVKLKQIEKMHI